MGLKETITEILYFLSDLGYIGIALGLMIEIIPSEIVLAYGGFMISEGKISFIGAVIAGTIGGVFAQLFLYWLGRYGGRPVIEKYGKYIFIHKKHIDLSEKWFEKYGSAVVFFARFIPVVRHAISIPAGLTKMSLKNFISYTVLAVVPWSMLFLYLGMKLKSNWNNINEVASEYIHPTIILSISILLIYIIVTFFKNKKTS